MDPSHEIGVGVIGLGFMGRTHIGAFRKASEAAFANRLVAVCDASAERRTGRRVGPGGNFEAENDDALLFDPREVRGTADPGELLADADVDLVSICTPTATHVDLAIEALRAQKHVLLEKPVALASGEVERLLAAARESDRVCMPAMCVRFWPGWSWVAERVRERSFGPVRSAVLRRLGTRPAWADFYSDPGQSGGALFDLHVHDADFVRHVFGPPRAVATTGTLDHVTTLYSYGADGPPHVVAEGGWDHTPGFPFHMGFTVVFERATAEYRFDREPRLHLSRDGAETPVDVGDLDGYDGEVRHLLGCLRAGTRPTATLEQALALTRMLEAERTSMGSGATVHLPQD